MSGLAITLYCQPLLPVHPDRRHPLARVLDEAGHAVIQTGDAPFDPGGCDVVWIWGNANWFPKLRRQLTALPRSQRPVTIIWHSEPLPPPAAARLPRPRLHAKEIAKMILRPARASDVYTNYRRLRRLAEQGLPDILVVSTPARQEFLAERGLAAHWVPLGYHATHGHDLGLHRDIDVLFLGALDVPRRRGFLERLRRQGLAVHAMGDWFDPACWGDNRTHLLNRTKILLNFGRYPGELSGMRLILGMANKALVVSEPIYNPAPYVPGEHYVSATLDEFPAVVAHYLAHEDERLQIVEAGHRLVTQDVTLQQSAARILALIAQRIGSRDRGAPHHSTSRVGWS